MKKKINTTHSIRSSYKYYKPSEHGKVSVKEYCDIINGYCEFLMDKVKNGKHVELPCGLGSVDIYGKKYELRLDEKGKPVATAVDWKKTKELWAKKPELSNGPNKKMVYHLNEHTDGMRYRFKWKKDKIENVRNKTLYSFIASRANKRHVSSLIKSGVKHYRNIKRYF